MKTRFFQAEMKEIELKEWSIKIKGFASTPDVDRYNDIVNPKAFKNAIEWYMANPVILLQHNSDKPIWKTIEYKVSWKGLNITVELTNDLDNVFKNIQDWILKWFSIWFIPKKWEYKMEWDKEIREITEVDLIEISVVSTPANPTSLFTLSKSVKSFFEEIKEDEFINNKNIMENEVKEIEEKETVAETIADAPIVDLTEEKEVEEVIVEWTSVVNPDEIESVDESSTTETEVVENTTEVADDEAGSEMEKDFADMKKDLAEQKKLSDTLLDTVIELSEKLLEIKGNVDAMPIRKWLATLWVEKKTTDSFVQALYDAKQNY